MEKRDEEIIALLKEQNQLLRKLLTFERRSRWSDMAMKFLPVILALVVVVWLYWSFSSTVHQLTVQVTEIREGVNSMFGLLTEQFSNLNKYFSALLSGLKGVLPNLNDFPDLIREQFLSS